MLRKLVIGVAAAGGLSVAAGAALADGMPGAPKYQTYRGCANWAGVYVGGHVGAAWAKTDWLWINDNYFDLAPGDRSKIDPFSYIGGFHGGIQHQLGCWVAGFEATYSAGDITKDIVSPFFPEFDTHSAALSRVTTVTARLGYSAGDWLFYGKGGYAGARVELFAQTNNTFGQDAQSQSDQWHNGWTVGTGFEVQLGSSMGKSITFGLEYNYIDLGNRTHTLACTPAGCQGFPDAIVRADVDMHVVTARLTFLLGREHRVEPLK